MAYPNDSLDSSIGRQRRCFSRGQTAALSLIGVIVLLLMCVLTAQFWLPAILRAVVPDRYIVAYAPQFVQDMVFENNAGQTLPTAVPLDPAVAGDLLISPTPVIADGTVVATQNSPQTEVPTTTLALTSSPTPEPDIPPIVMLEGFTHTYQGWNNCGPATLTTTLSHWDLGVTQEVVAEFVKPNKEDRNVRPDELVAFAESIGFNGQVRVDGNIRLLKRIIAAGYPVIVETGFDPEPDRLGWMGHYIVLIGYSDPELQFTAMDSYLGPNTKEPYGTLDQFWRHFDRTYIVVYPQEDHEKVAAIIGDEMDDTVMYNHSIDTARAELLVNSQDAFGWFNLGSSLVALGRYEEATAAFDQARAIGVPWRMLWYQYGPYEAYLHVERYDDVIALAERIIADNEYSEEAFYYKGRVYEAQGQTDVARNNYQAALNQNWHYEAAQQALDALGN
jgi:hypothetical protein